MEMQQVRYFLALARELNFTRAAEACNVTQPALTRAIQGLEAELGGPLFHRERSRTHLSELGRMMLPHLASIQEQAEAAKSGAKTYAKAEHVALKLGAMCTIGPRVIADFILRFRDDFPNVMLDVRDASADALARSLLDGDLEVGLLAIPEATDERLHLLPLFTERFICVLPPGHRLAERNMVRVQDLDDEPYINRSNCEVGPSAAQKFAERGARVRMVFQSERDDWVLGMIRAGLGWGFFPEFCAIPDDLPARPLVEPGFERAISLVTTRGRPHSPAVGAFVRGARTQRWPQPER